VRISPTTREVQPRRERRRTAVASCDVRMTVSRSHVTLRVTVHRDIGRMNDITVSKIAQPSVADRAPSRGRQISPNMLAAIDGLVTIRTHDHGRGQVRGNKSISLSPIQSSSNRGRRAAFSVRGPNARGV
jgi:hypothetical protein